MDLINHSGGVIIRGADHAWTLTFTDACMAWSECVPVRNMAQVHVLDAIQRDRARLPFPLLGLDSDNGAEFVKGQLVRYCKAEHITFTRGRSGRKNDSCCAEQWNWRLVGRAVGYEHSDTPDQLDPRSRLHTCLQNYCIFLPVMKLASRSRLGSRVTRTYDQPQALYAHVLASPDDADEYRELLGETCTLLYLDELRHQIVDMQRALYRAFSAP